MTEHINPIQDFKKATEEYKIAIAVMEDLNLDSISKKEAAAIIEETQIHEEIALEHILS